MLKLIHNMISYKNIVEYCHIWYNYAYKVVMFIKIN